MVAVTVFPTKIVFANSTSSPTSFLGGGSSFGGTLSSIESALGLGGSPAPINPNAASNSKVLNSPECKNLAAGANAGKTNHLGTVAQIMNSFSHVFDNLITNLESCIDGLLSMFGSFNFNLPICAWLTSASSQLMKNVNANIAFPYGMGGLNLGGTAGGGLNPGGSPINIGSGFGGSLGLPTGGSLMPSYNSFANGQVVDPLTGTSATGSLNTSGGSGAANSSNATGSWTGPLKGLFQ